MKASPFQEFVEDQLKGIPDLAFRRMFGGFGLYSGEVFFGIIHRETLYLRTCDRTKMRYEDAGMTFFTAPGSQKALKHYYEVPLAVLEQNRDLLEWAREAISTNHLA